MKHKAYIDGYWGYDYYTSRSQSKRLALISNDLAKELKDMTYKGFDLGYFPAKGDAINTVSPCELPIEDLRKNYAIKRGIDTATCVVFSPLKSEQYMYDSIVVVPSKKAVFVGRLGWDYVRKTIQQAFGSIPSDACELPSERYNIIELTPAYEKLLDGTFSTPAIPISNLKINQDNELTYDALYLVYKTGTVACPSCRYWEHESEVKNFTTELSVLNNYNWRDYLGTIGILNNIMLYRSDPDENGNSRCKTPTVANAVKNCISRYPKPVKLIMSVDSSSKFVSEKDFLMAKKFIGTLLGLEGTKFVRFEDLLRNIEKIDLPLYLFNRLYDTVTRITERKYEDGGDGESGVR